MKRFLNYFLIIILSSPLYADFKIMGGINLSTYTSLPQEENVQWNSKRGFAVGIGLEKSLNQYLHLEFDILFFKKGSIKESTGSFDSKLIYNLNSVSFPGLLKIKLFHGTSPYITGGAELSLILSHKIKSEEDEEVDIKENTRLFDYGFVFGGGFEIEIKEQLFLFIEARYHRGKRNILGLELEDQSIKTNSFFIVVGAKS